LLVALVVVAVAAAGCGGDKAGKGIPAATATRLDAQLDNVQARLDQGSVGACKDIIEGPRGPNKQQTQDLIDSMPGDVDSDVKSALQDSFDNLWDLVQQECDDKASKTETNTTTTETPTETTTTETQTETTTTPTETTTTPTETSPGAAPLPNDGNGNGGGAVPGTGNGGGGVGPSGEKQGKKEKNK
jgi:hypothetical protein